MAWAENSSKSFRTYEFNKKSEKMPPNLRIASESDAAEIATLVNRAYRPAPHERRWTHEADLISGPRTSAAQVRTLFGLQSCILVLCIEQKIIACVHLLGEESSVYIGMLATDPALQVQGLGKQMLQHAEWYAAAHFNASVFKMSVLSSRPELLAFYQRRGYVCTGEIEDYPVSAGVGQPIIKSLHLVGLSKIHTSNS
jgi:ribosomal protein S18 acetylase RimI-like enzyme